MCFSIAVGGEISGGNGVSATGRRRDINTKVRTCLDLLLKRVIPL